MKDLLSKLTQLNEANFERSFRGGPTGDFREPGTERGTLVPGKKDRYGQGEEEEEDGDDGDGKKTATASTERRGRGRPPGKKSIKATAASFGNGQGIQDLLGKKPNKPTKLPTTKHRLSDEEPKQKKSTTESLKDWIATIDEQRMLAEATPTTTSNASQKVIVKPGQPTGEKPPATMTTQTGQTVAVGSADQVKKLGDLVNAGEVQLTKPGTTEPLAEIETNPNTDDATQVLKDIFAQEEDPFDSVYLLLGTNTPAGKIVQDMYTEIYNSGIWRRQPGHQAPYEKALYILLDQLEEKYGQQDVAESSFDIDTTGYTKNDMAFINREQKQIKQIQQRLLEIPGFVKEMPDPDDQKKLAEKIIELMMQGMTFDSALVLAQKNPSQQGMAEGSMDDDREKIEHLMQKYHWSYQEAMEYLHYHEDEHEPDEWDGMSEAKPSRAQKQDVAEGSAHGYNVVKWYEKWGDQIKLTRWLKKEAGLPKDAKVYFDDANLVYGGKTIVPNALVNPKLKLNDLLTAVVNASGSGKVLQDMGGYYRESAQPPRDGLASPFTMEESKMPMKKVNGKSVPSFAADGKGKNDLKNKKVEKVEKVIGSASKTGKNKMPSKSDIEKMCNDGKTVAQICKMHSNCDQAALKKMIADCKKKMVAEGMGMTHTFAILDRKLMKKIIPLPYAVVDYDANSVATSDENLAKQLIKFAQENPTRLKRTQSINTAGVKPMAQFVGGTSSGPVYNLRENADHLRAEHHRGKADAMSGGGYSCRHRKGTAEARHYHMGFMEGIDECYGGGNQMPIQGMVDEMSDVVDTMASYGAHTPELDEMDKTEYMTKETPGNTYHAFDQTLPDSGVLGEFAFESLDRQLNALLNEDSVSEGMTVSISKGQENSPDSVSINASDAEADSLLAFVKQAGLGIFGGDHGATQDAVVTSEPSIASSGAIEVVDDHDGMLSLIRKMAGQSGAVSGAEGNSSDYADEEGDEGSEHFGHDGGHEHGEGDDTCNECGMAYESCGCDESVVDEQGTPDQDLEMAAEDSTDPNVGAVADQAAELDAEEAGTAAEEATAASGGGATNEAFGFNKDGSYNTSDEEAMEFDDDQADDEDDEYDHDAAGNIRRRGGHDAAGHFDMTKESMSESSFFNLYKKLALLSEESTAEKDDKAEKDAEEVANDIEYDEGHKGKDDKKAEEAGEKVKNDIEYDDKKAKKLKEWANSPQQSSHDEQFETDIEFMTNVISGGLNKQKIRVGSGGQTTVPVVAAVTTNESTDLLTQWKKLSGI